MYKIKHHEFDMAYTILKDSFPKAELRKYDVMKEFFDKNELSFFGIKKDNELAVVLISWEFDDFVFLENFAVKDYFRKQGLGSLCLSYIKDYYHKTIVLEVEKPYDETSNKRIEFYKKNDFILSEFGYIQPPLNICLMDIPLIMMSYPDSINEEQFLNIKKQIFHRVYQKEVD